MDIPPSINGSSLGMFHHFGYGVLLDGTVALSGVQNFLMRENARMLASRIAPEGIPAELVEQIAHELYLKRKHMPKSNRRKVTYLMKPETDALHEHERLLPPAALALREKMAELGVRLAFLRLSNEGNILARRARYAGAALIWQEGKVPEIQLCHFESENFHPASGPVQDEQSRHYSMTNAFVRETADSSRAQDGGGEGFSLNTELWVPTDEPLESQQGETLCSLAVCRGVQRAIESWDAAAAMKFANLLELDIPLEPQFVIHQTLIDNPVMETLPESWDAASDSESSFSSS